MRFFKKKVTEEEFHEFEKRVQQSLKKMKKENQDLKNQLEVLTKVTMSLCLLSKQFTELVKQFSNGSLNRREKEDTTPAFSLRINKKRLQKVSLRSIQAISPSWSRRIWCLSEGCKTRQVGE